LKTSTPGAKTIILGVACGAGAATFWACGLVAARHGIAVGLSPFDIALHRYVWAGFVFLPGVLRLGVRRLGGIGWGRSLVFMVLSGPIQATASAGGFLLAPLAHAGVIQPAASVVTGLLLATFLLGEKQPPARILGAAAMVAGIAVIGSEALTSIGGPGMLGDAIFALAGMLFATFGTMLRLWRIMPARATAVIGALTLLLYAPAYAAVFGFGRMIAAGLIENLLQAVVQGVFSGPLATFLFARSVMLLGASRAAVFPSLVPGLTLVAGFLALGDVPSVLQLTGLCVVLVGFRLTQRA
jgi:drug/metabolite transporter (DMT)-like permease